MMATATARIEDLTLNINQEIHVKAPLDVRPALFGATGARQ